MDERASSTSQRPVGHLARSAWCPEWSVKASASGDAEQPPRRFQLLVGWFDEEHFPGCEAVHEQTVPSRSYERDGHRENCAVLLARFDGDRVERTELPFVHST